MNYELFVPENPIFNCDFFSIHATPNLEKFSKDVFACINEKRSEILDFFGIDEFRKVQINLYDQKETFVKFTSQFFEPKSYAIGNFAMGMANFYVNVDEIEDERVYNSRIRGIVHEFVHLVYKEQVQEQGINNRTVWLDEGLAIYLSGQKSGLNDIDKFKSWFLNNIVRRDKIIPEISFLKKHGDKFGEFCDNETRTYNGYDLSYLIVRYLVETFSQHKLQTIIREKSLIEELEKTVLKNTVDYYLNKFPVKNSFKEVSTPSELLDYMNKNMLYGWTDYNGESHIDNMKDFRKMYRTGSIEDTINLKIGTCIEQTRFEKEFFRKMNIPHKMYALRSYELTEEASDNVKMHCFLLFNYNGKCYHFEHSNHSISGIHEYDNEENALENITEYYQKKDGGKSRRLDEFDEVPAGLSFEEFNLYLNQIDVRKSL